MPYMPYTTGVHRPPQRQPPTREIAPETGVVAPVKQPPQLGGTAPEKTSRPQRFNRQQRKRYKARLQMEAFGG